MLPLWDSQKLARGSGGVTTFLVGANLIIFVVQLALSLAAPAAMETLFHRFALVPSHWVHGWQTGAAWVPIGTSMFLHGGVAHVLGNMWFLWVFGRSLESHLGGVRFFVVYLVAGVGAALSQVAFSPTSVVPMIGASGAISGVLGAYFRLMPTRWVVTLVPWVVPILPLPAFVFLFLWFALQLSSGLGLLGGGAEGGVAWWAHVGGFLSGVAMAGVLGPPKRGKKGKSLGRARKSVN